ncbi:MAG TPA: restriction endonuclease, partial [archaeon]|nr:restriction endonuclease [archaeon]
MVSVVKFDGRSQEFQKEKVIKTCLRMHANHQQAIEIANKIEGKTYDGMTTKEILNLIFRYLKEYRPEIGHEIDLKEAISLLRPKPDFEVFVQIMLKEIGYEVTSNRILRGKCVDHEIDGVAKKDGKTFLVEVKHHMNHHTYSGIDVCLISQASAEDLVEGFHSGKTEIKFDKVMIVCNTKFSDQARQYAE